MRILHAFKIYRPEVEGGVPEIMGLLTGASGPNNKSRILVARSFGIGRAVDVDGVPVTSVTSLGNMFSMPVAPTFPFALARQARQADVVVLHVPFPLNDIGVLGIPAKVGLVVHWHSDIIGQRFLLPLVAPFIRHTLSRADRIIVSNASIISLSPFLKSHVAKCVVIPFGTDLDYWSRLTPEEQAEVERIRAVHRRLVVATGRLVTYKGFDVLIRALREIDATLVIVGDGPRAKCASAAGEATRHRRPGRIRRERPPGPPEALPARGACLRIPVDDIRRDVRHCAARGDGRRRADRQHGAADRRPAGRARRLGGPDGGAQRRVRAGGGDRAPARR